MKNNIYVGIDASPTGTAIVAWCGGKILKNVSWTTSIELYKDFPDVLRFYKMQKANVENKIKRVHHVFQWFMEFMGEVMQHGGDVYIALEGYAYSAKGQSKSCIHELTGLIKCWLYHEGLPLRIYEPTTIKAAWTGMAHASKGQMINACSSMLGVDYTFLKSRSGKLADASNNMADAALIGKMLEYEVLIKQEGEVPRGLPITMARVLHKKPKKSLPIIETPFIVRGG